MLNNDYLECLQMVSMCENLLSVSSLGVSKIWQMTQIFLMAISRGELTENVDRTSMQINTHKNM